MYSIDDRQLVSGAADFGLDLATAHRTHRRPLCACTGTRPPLYVAKLGDRYVLKRMPGTGSWHARDCIHHEGMIVAPAIEARPAPAIREDVSSGITYVRVDFPMSVGGPVADRPGSAARSASDILSSSRLSLSGLLHFLWERAELTLWRPSFEGKRNWAVVRRRLLAAAADIVVSGVPLKQALYIPEFFAVDRRDEINMRRQQAFESRRTPRGALRPLMLLIGEIKRLIPSDRLYMAILRHAPDQPFAMTDLLYRSLSERRNEELARTQFPGSVRLLLIGTFSVGEGYVPILGSASLMSVTPQWIPVA